MAALTVTAFNGTTLNGTSEYVVVLNGDGDSGYAASATTRQRRMRTPIEEAVTYSERTLGFIVTRAPSAVSAYATWEQAVYRIFNPHGSAQSLVASMPDGTTGWSVTARVRTLRKVGTHFVGEFVVADAGWKSATTTGPYGGGTVTLASDTTVYPSIAVSGTAGTLRRRRVTVVDNTGRGLAGYPIRCSFDSSGVGASATSNYIAFVDVQPVPIATRFPNSGTTAVWCRVDLPPAGTTTVDVYYGSGVANTTTAETLQGGGLDFAKSSGTSWVWSDWRLSNSPVAIGAILPAYQATDVSTKPAMNARVATEGSASTTWTMGINNPTGHLITNGFRVVTGVEAAGTSLANLTRVFNLNLVLSGTVTWARGFIRSRTAGQRTLTDAWSGTAWVNGTATFTNTVDIQDAVEFLVGIESSGTATTLYPNATMQLFGAGAGSSFSLGLNAGSVPSVTVDAAGTARYLSGDLVLTYPDATAGTVTFDQIYWDDVALTVDADAQTIAAASGPLYTAGNGVTFSDPDGWVTLSNGVSTWSNPANGSAAVSWYERRAL